MVATNLLGVEVQIQLGHPEVGKHGRVVAVTYCPNKLKFILLVERNGSTFTVEHQHVKYVTKKGELRHE